MKISIVTPCYNMDRFIAETIESIISQAGDFDLEYIIQDGGSTDQSISIIKSYEQKISNGTWPKKCNSIDFKWFSEKDTGMYDAINKGFAKATGDIYAWLNADDLYEKDSFQTIVDVSKKFPDVQWMKGLVTLIEIDGQFIRKSPPRIYHQDWLIKGIYGESAYFVEQDTVFWRAELWKKHCPIPTEYRYSGDYWVWVELAKSAKLWTLNAPISFFRKRSDQLSQNMKATRDERRAIMPHRDVLVFFAVRVFFNLWSRSWTPKNFLEKIYNLFFRNRKKEDFIEISNIQGKKTYTKKQARSFRAI